MDDVIALGLRFAGGAWRKRWLGITLAWLICLIGWAGVMVLPPKYESSAQLYVAADPVLTPLLEGIAINGNTREEFSLLQRTLLSDPNLGTLLDKTGLGLNAEGPGAREAMIRGLRSQIQIVPQTDNLFTISYQSPDPKKAYEVVQGLVNIYVERASVRNQGDIDNARSFLDSQITYFHTQLKQLEQRRASFQAKYLQLLPGVDGVSAYEQEQTKVRQLNGTLQDAIAERELIEKQLATTTPLLTGAAALSSGSGGAALATAEGREAELKQQYTDAYPGVVAAERKVEALKKMSRGGSSGGGAMPAIANPVYEQLRLQLLKIDTTLFSLRRQIKASTAERDRLAALARSQPGIAARYINLDRNYTVLQTEYHNLIERREAMRIGAAANVDANRIQLQVVNPPQVPRLPIAPNRPLLLVAVLFLGVGAGVAVAALLAELEGRYETLDDLKKLGLPVIGGISDVRRRAGNLGPALRVAAAMALLFVIFGGFMVGSVIMQRFA
ncbi:MAG: lipopolysaccharide biosynthesis protein [Acidiphilium sp.]|nr:lipopolysaccharide biosynthesis protein [Acidiphilium sp.]MDD4935317.1 lipopolysaccharide biosynthesis protein [Acidiphilium sp.]